MRGLTLVAGVLAWVLGAADAARACSCAASTLADAVAGADVVALVSVAAVEALPDGGARARVTFDEVVRGPARGTTHVVRWVRPDGKSCHLVDLAPGRWRLLAQWGPGGALMISRCDAQTRALGRVGPAAVAANKAEIMRVLKPVGSEADARVVAARAATPMLRAALAASQDAARAAGGMVLSDSERDALELARVDAALVTRRADGVWIVRWSRHPTAGTQVEAEVHVRADGSAEVVRAEASFSPD